MNENAISYSEIYAALRWWDRWVYVRCAWRALRLFSRIVWREKDTPVPVSWWQSRLPIALAASVAYGVHFGDPGPLYDRALLRCCRRRWGINFVPCNIIFQLPGNAPEEGAKQ